MRTRTAAAPSTTRTAFLEDLRAALELEQEYQRVTRDGRAPVLSVQAFRRKAQALAGASPERLRTVRAQLEAHRDACAMLWSWIGNRFDALRERQWWDPITTATGALRVFLRDDQRQSVQTELGAEGITIWELQAVCVELAAETHPEWFGVIDDDDLARVAELTAKRNAVWATLGREADAYERGDLVIRDFDRAGRAFVGFAVAPNEAIRKAIDVFGRIEPLEDVGRRLREHLMARPDIVARILER
jgi:hypothetical protein